MVDYILLAKRVFAMSVQIEKSWKALLDKEFHSDYFPRIKDFILQEKAKGKEVYPPGPFIFRAFDLCSFTDVRVVLLGQDPYHGPGQAHGLCFSVPNGIPAPPSLHNILKEIQSDTGISSQTSGDLSVWAEQGVLLLNTILTVNKSEPGSHKNAGWSKFTDAVIRKISDEKTGIIFLLWGNFAQEKAVLIDKNKHYVLEAAHPSPFSAHKGFFGCKHFSKTNALLSSPIRW